MLAQMQEPPRQRVDFRQVFALRPVKLSDGGGFAWLQRVWMIDASGGRVLYSRNLLPIGAAVGWKSPKK